MPEHRDQLLRFACLVARADFDLARASNLFDRMTILANAVLLLFLAALAVTAWTAFWASFLPLGAAILLGLLVGCIVFLIDQAISAADWELAGVLRTEPMRGAYWLKVVPRIVIAFLFALATSVGATLWMFGGTIDADLQSKRMLKNAPVEREYAQRDADVEARLIKPLVKEIESKQLERDALQRQMETLAAERDDANKRASRARIEAGREADGGLPGYIRGEGPRFREAQRQEREAIELNQRTSSDARALQARMALADESIARMSAALERKQLEYRALGREIRNEKVHDPRWVPQRNDPLLRYIALYDIQRNPDTGAAATEFRRLMMLVLLTLELSFLFVKVACAPASVYMVRLIARTKRDAARVSAEFARDLDEIKRDRPRGSLRVIGGQPEQRSREGE